MNLKNSFATSGRLGLLPLDTVSEKAQWALGDKQEFKTELGSVECVYLQAGVGGVFRGSLCCMDNGIAVTAPVTGNQGASVCVALVDVPYKSYAWFGCNGQVELKSATAVTKGGKVYLGLNAGEVTATQGAGKQVLNATFSDNATAGLVSAYVQHSGLQGQIS